MAWVLCGVCAAAGSASGAPEITVRIDTPEAPPQWALMQRHLFDLMHEAAVFFVNEKRNVRIDHENEQIVLSDIFKMYEKDFINDLRRRGLPTTHGLIDYVASVAQEPLRGELLESPDYKIVFDRYDWSINKTTADN